MGGCRCSYRNCANTTKTRDNLHFFHYPVKQKDRCRQWIENANKPQFYDLDEDQLRNKVVCESHFEDCYFPNSQKKRLLQGAVPTLDGDCEDEDGRALKIQDVQVLPANDDGTIFVLETNNMLNNFQSECIESYIYTNTGLVLPISKVNSIIDDSPNSYSIHEDEESREFKFKAEQEVSANDNFVLEKKTGRFVFPTEDNSNSQDVQMVTAPPTKINSLQKPLSKKQPVKSTTPDDTFTKSVSNKYVKKIQQHSKDIALLKRLIKSKTPYRKPGNNTIINTLKKQIPTSLLSVINFNLNDNFELTLEDLEFFSKIYSTSPEVYRLLTQKYSWKLPSPDILNTLINDYNGGVHCDK